jgi:hypothetical protein
MSLIGDVVRAAKAEERPTIVVVTERDAHQAFLKTNYDRQLYAALLDAPTAHLIESLDAARQNLSPAARRERQRKRQEETDLQVELRSARA